MAAYNEALEKKQFNHNDALEYLGAQFLIPKNQVRTKIRRIQETSPQYSVAAYNEVLEKKQFNYNDALEYLGAQFLIPENQVRTKIRRI